jgi:hypothetical protein
VEYWSYQQGHQNTGVTDPDEIGGLLHRQQQGLQHNECFILPIVVLAVRVQQLPIHVSSPLPTRSN